MKRITLSLPLPDPWLSPNKPAATRGSRMAKSVATKRARMLAYLEATSTMRLSDVSPVPWSRARATAVFYWPDRRRRDVRNAEASLKAYYDGVVDAGLIADDSYAELRHGETGFDIDRERPRVEIAFEQLETP